MSTNEVEKLLHDLQSVLEVSRAMTLEHDLDRLLDLIVTAVSDLVGADRASLFIVDAPAKELWTHTAQGTEIIRLPIGSGIAGNVAITGETINIEDAQADDRFNSENDKRTGYQTRSMLCMPLISHDDLIVGVLQTLNKKDAPCFNKYDEEILSALCSQAAVAIDKTQLIAADLERETLAHDMEVARGIQQTLLPDAVPVMKEWAFAAYQECCDQTGGDYYDFVKTNDNTDCDIIVGDVSGHGIGAALMMSSARAFLLGLYEHNQELQSLLAALNNLLERDMADDTFMTMCIARAFKDGHLEYVSAGHEPPFVWRTSKQVFDELDSTGILLGAIDDAEYGVETVSALGKGDVFVMITDGIFEAHHKETGEEWGVERMKACIAQHADAGAEAVLAALLRELREHVGGKQRADDITIVVGERLL